VCAQIVERIGGAMIQKISDVTSSKINSLFFLITLVFKGQRLVYERSHSNI